MSRWIFFFFKQKTAYEMRISDWSSDVCSSDLAGPLGDQAQHGEDVLGAGLVLAEQLGERLLREHFLFGTAHSAASWRRASCTARHTFSGVAGMSTWRMPSGDSASTTALITAGQEIGRASCRERVCQYV